MILRNSEWSFGVEIEKVTSLVMEDNVMMRKLAWSIYMQSEGGEGVLRIFDGDSEIKWNKEVFYASSPASFNPSDKRIITKFYEELKTDAISIWQDRYYSVCNELNRFVIELLDNTNIYSRFNDDIEPESIFRIFNIGFLEKSFSEDMLEYILRNLQLIDKYLHPKIMISTGFQMYFAEQEWEVFCYELCLRNIRLLNIESNHSYQNQFQKVYTIDEDCCLF